MVPLASYIANLAQPGVYADHHAVQYLGEALDCCIKIVQTNKKDINVGSLNSKIILTVGYLSHLEHYVSVIDEYSAANLLPLSENIIMLCITQIHGRIL